MSALRDAVVRILAFSAVAGCAELLLPDGPLKRSASGVLAMFSVKMLLEIAFGLLGID